MTEEDNKIYMKKVYILLKVDNEIKKYQAYVDDLDEIEDIKYKIYNTFDITADQQKLIHKNVEMIDGCIEDYGVEEEDEIELVLDITTLRISVFSRYRTLELVQRANNDFPWYLKLQPGFCIKVQCTNSFCETQKEFNGTSILLYGYGQFDFIIMLKNGFRCKACDHIALPMTCGFTKCRWFVECRQQGRGTKDIKKEGEMPADKLIEYDDVKVSNWDYLRFIVVPR